MKKVKFETELVYINDIKDLEPALCDLILQSEKAQESAYAPHSNFQVGAAVLLQNGTVMRGSNQENMAYPSGLCAERVAIFAAGAQYPGEIIKAVSVSCDADETVPYHAPCGGCRQVLYEYEWKQKQSIMVYLHIRGRKDAWVIDSVSGLLPYPFIF